MGQDAVPYPTQPLGGSGGKLIQGDSSPEMANGRFENLQTFGMPYWQWQNAMRQGQGKPPDTFSRQYPPDAASPGNSPGNPLSLESIQANMSQQFKGWIKAQPELMALMGQPKSPSQKRSPDGSVSSPAKPKKKRQTVDLGIDETAFSCKTSTSKEPYKMTSYNAGGDVEDVPEDTGASNEGEEYSSHSPETGNSGGHYSGAEAGGGGYEDSHPSQSHAEPSHYDLSGGGDGGYSDPGEDWGPHPIDDIAPSGPDPIMDSAGDDS